MEIFLFLLISQYLIHDSLQFLIDSPTLDGLIIKCESCN